MIEIKKEHALLFTIMVLVIIVVALIIHYNVLPKYKQKITSEVYNQTKNLTERSIAIYQQQTGNILHIANNTLVETNINKLCREG